MLKVVPEAKVEVPIASCVPFVMKDAFPVSAFVPFQNVTWFAAPDPVKFEVLEIKQVPFTEKQPVATLIPLPAEEVAVPVMVKPFVRVRPFAAIPPAKVEVALPVTEIPLLDERPPTERPEETVEVPAPET